MSSPSKRADLGMNVEGPSWSLTRRLTWLFVGTIAALMVIYSLWSGYFVFDTIRDEANAFLIHEADELVHGLEQAHFEEEGVREIVEEIAASIEEPARAVRVRLANGVSIASGSERLLALLPNVVKDGLSWREHLFDRGVVLHSDVIREQNLSFVIIVSGKGYLDRLKSYGKGAAYLLVAALLFSWSAGAFAIRRGLAGLRDVVAQAQLSNVGRRAEPVSLANAPEEVRVVGKALDDVLDRIETRFDEMRTFIAGLAHELRSPLQNLIGETEVTLLARRDADEYERLLRSNVDELGALSDAIDNLVAYCRSAEVASEPPGREDFDLAQEISLRLQRERSIAERAHVQLEISCVGNTRLRTDREGCLRLLRNLVLNAIEWSPRNSIVRVKIQGASDGVSIVVEDEGPGVTKELGDQVFVPFVSGRSPERKRTGYGLGLAICRTVMENHGGTIRHEPLEPHGTRFVAFFGR